MKVWNKETRREDGSFYRFEDWSIEVKEDFKKSNFTDQQPPQETLEYSVPCDFVGGAWVVDTSSEEYKTLYKKKREKEYLPIQEQLDLIYWDKVNGTKKWQAHIASIKAKYPKK